MVLYHSSLIFSYGWRKRFLLIITLLCASCIGLYAQSSVPSEETPVPVAEPVKQYNDDIWKHKKKFMLGFTMGELDQKVRFGGKINSRWGISLTSGRNIYLHPKAIGGFLKFGVNIDFEFNYLNFAKGKGSLSDISGSANPGGETVSLGRHYLTGGIAVGPTATFAPFYASSNRNLASLKFRPYFHVVPSYAGYLVSDSDDTEIHSAFAFWYAAGMEVQWKRLIVGVGWKGSIAKYKGMMDSILSDFEDGFASQGSYKFDTNMVNISVGFAF